MVFLATTTMAAAEVLWQDNFDTPAAPNSDYWSFDTGAGGWGNNELQEYTTTNALVNDGTLKITAERQGDTFTSSRINTKDKVEVKYGNIEARIKVPNVANGLWPAFWTLGHTFPEVPWPGCGELDIMEVGQGSAGTLINNRIVSAAHWLHGDDVIASWPGSLDFGSFLYDDFHVYKLEWTPEFLVTYIDDTEIWRMNIGLSECVSCEELHHHHFLVLNLAVGGGFTKGDHSSCGYSSSNALGGCPAPTPDEITASFPAVMEVDYVRIVANEHTQVYLPKPPQGDAVASNPVTPAASSTTNAPTTFPTWSPTKDSDDYVDDNWGKSSKGSSKGKGSKGKSEGDVLCENGGKGKSGKGGKGKSGSKSGKGMSKGKGKGKSGSDCGSSTSLRTASTQLGSSAVRPHWSTWLSAVLVLPALFWG